MVICVGGLSKIMVLRWMTWKTQKNRSGFAFCKMDNDTKTIVLRLIIWTTNTTQNSGVAWDDMKAHNKNTCIALENLENETKTVACFG